MPRRHSAGFEPGVRLSGGAVRLVVPAALLVGMMLGAALPPRARPPAPGQAAPAAAPAEELRAVADRVVDAVRREDWDALRPDAAPVVVFGGYARLYEQLIPAADRRWFETDLLFPSADARGRGRPGRYAATYLAVETGGPLGGYERQVFAGFCAVVRDSWRHDVGEEEPGAEVRELRGPAAVGKLASNVHYRIEFEREAGRWRARRFLVETH
jgi:hypothetical protein